MNFYSHSRTATRVRRTRAKRKKCRLSFWTLLVPVPLLVAGVLCIPSGHGRTAPRLAESSSLLPLLAALCASAVFAVHGQAPARPVPADAVAARLDAVSVTMLLLVSFIGWIVVRFARNYLDGEARQGVSPAGCA